MRIKAYGDCHVLYVGKMEIWDGAELALIRETLRRLIDEEQFHLLGVDMSYVKYVPSGFFGMLCEWHDNGIRFRLLNPSSHVKRMLWFTTFFQAIGDDFHELRPAPVEDFGEPNLESAPSDPPATTRDSSLTTNEPHISSVSIQANENVDLSTTLPRL